jgi:plastocyanin
VLYLFTNDAPGVSNCSGNCALNWPPLLTVEAPEAGEGADADMLDVISRGDGMSQVTYNGWPLYYYAKDTGAGDKQGQGRNDVWWVVNAEGEAVMEPVEGSGGESVASNIVGFELEDLSVTVGQTVRWTNQDAAPHTATSGTGSPSGVFDSGTLSQGGSYEYTFSQAGSFPYYCKIHPDMTGTVTVTQ